MRLYCQVIITSVRQCIYLWIGTFATLFCSLGLALETPYPDSGRGKSFPAYQLAVGTHLWVIAGSGASRFSTVPLYSKLEDAKSSDIISIEPLKGPDPAFYPKRDYSFEIVEIISGAEIGSLEMYSSKARPWLYKIKLDDDKTYYVSEAKVNLFMAKTNSKQMPKKYSTKMSSQEATSYQALALPMYNIDKHQSDVIVDEEPKVFLENAKRWIAWIDKNYPKPKPQKEGVSIGMTQDQVRASNWGRPQSVNRTTTARGVHEQWVYGGGYLYFENGILTTIQN